MSVDKNQIGEAAPTTLRTPGGSLSANFGRRNRHALAVGSLVLVAVLLFLSPGVAQAQASESVSGVITAAEDGAPVPGVLVDIFSAQRADFIGFAETNNAGVFSYDLPGAACYVATFIAPDPESVWRANGSRFRNVDFCVGVGEVVTGLDGVLSGGLSLGSLSGLVSDGGGPVSGVEAALFEAAADGSRGSWVGSDYSSGDGLFGFEVPAGCYLIDLVAPGGRSWVDDDGFLRLAACVGAGEVVTGLDGVLSGGLSLGSLSGLVSDGGGPVSGVEAALFEAAADGSRGSWVGSDYSSGDGLFGFEVPAGCYLIDLVAPGGRSWVDDDGFLRLAACVGAGEVVTGLDGVLSGGLSLGSLSGLVSDGGGPVSGVEAALFEAAADGSRGSWVGSDYSSGDGLFGFEVPAGCYLIDLVAPGGRSWVDDDGFLRLAACVGAGEVVTGLDGVLARVEEPPAEVRICGRILGEEVWTASNVYIVECTTTVEGVLRLGPGVVVKSGSNAGLDIRSGGRLEVAGSASDPVVFTSAYDSSIGGVQFPGEEPSVENSPDDLVRVRSGGAADIEHAVFRFASAPGSSGVYVGHSVASVDELSIRDSLFEDNAVGVRLYNSYGVRIESSVFRDSSAAAIDSGSSGLSGIVLAGESMNRLEGSGAWITTSQSRVIEGNVWEVSGSSGAVLWASTNTSFNIEGVLRLGPGVVVKSGSNAGLDIRSGGRLEVAGSASDPVVFTSAYDSSIGGVQFPGEEPSVENSPDDLVRVRSGGAADIEHAVFRFASAPGSSGVYVGHSVASVDELSIRDSLFEDNAVGVRLYNSYGVRIESSVFRDSSAAAIDSGSSGLSGIVLAGESMNRLEGSGAWITTSQSRVIEGNVWEVSGSSGAVLWASTNTSFNIEGVLRLGPGVVVKSGSNAGLDIRSGGRLEVAGSASDPVVFTSAYDSSIGGVQFPGEEPSVENSPDDLVRVRGGGAADIEHAVFRFASAPGSSGVYVGHSVASVDELSIRDSLFEDNAVGVRLYNSYGVRIESSVFRDSSAAAIDSGSSGLSGIVLAGESMNRLEGSGAWITTSQSRVIEGNVWEVSGSSGAVLWASTNTSFNIEGVLRLGPGVVVKSGSNAGLDIRSGGRLEVAGSASDPVVFTSAYDSSIGGVQFPGEEPSVENSPDDLVLVRGGGAADIEHAVFRFASAPGSSGIAAVRSDFAPEVELSIRDSLFEDNAVGVTLYRSASDHLLINVDAVNVGVVLDVDGPVGRINFKGSILDSDYAFRGCKWVNGCAIDASYVEWGSGGPYDSTGDELFCGNVHSSPYYAEGVEFRPSPPTSGSCDGDPSPSTQLSNSAAAAFQRANDLCAISDDVCSVAELINNCLSAAWELGESNLGISFGGVEPADVSASWTEDVAVQALDQANAYPAATNLSAASGLLTVVEVFFGLKAAYDSCP